MTWAFQKRTLCTANCWRRLWKTKTAQCSFGHSEFAYFLQQWAAANKLTQNNHPPNGFLLRNRKKKSKKIIENVLKNQFAWPEAWLVNYRVLPSSFFFVPKNSSNNWRSRGWKDRNWAVAIHRIGRKVKNTLSFARPRCMLTQLWIS